MLFIRQIRLGARTPLRFSNLALPSIEMIKACGACLAERDVFAQVGKARC